MQETQLNGESLNIVSENVSKLKELFPEILTEDKIDFDKLKAVLGNYIEDDSERYSFTWKGKAEDLRLAQTPSNGTLRPCKDESKNWNTTENLYIEGDNLEVLKLLQKSYYGKIKMIYLDPPYNTGSNRIYQDNFQDNLKNYLNLTNQVDQEGYKKSTVLDSDGRKHTKWLNMMFPRLRLARNLLNDEGVIFVSIDDNEVHNLRMIMNQIFGEINLIAELPVIMNLKGNNDEFGFSGTHEYILVYAKNKSNLIFNEFPIEDDELKEWEKDEIGYYKQGANLKSTGTNAPRSKRPNLFYPIFINKDNKISLVEAEGYEKILPLTNREEMSWRWSKDKLESELYNVIIKRDDNKISLYKKQRPQLGDLPTKKPKSIFYKPQYSSGNGTKEIKDLFEKKIFENSKPTDLIKDLIILGSNKNDVVLDFFSGSGTTADALMQLNFENNGNRKFIMVQLPEPTEENSEGYKEGYKNICEIGKERIRRAGNKILSKMKQNGQTLLDSEQNTETELDIGFKVFKLDSSNLVKWDPEYDNIEQTLLNSVENIVPGRNKLDLIYEIILKYGIDLTLPIEEYTFNDGKTIYSIGFGALLICLDDNINLDISSEILKIKDKLSPEITRVVFKDNGFATDSDKTNVKETLKTHGIDEFVTI